MSLNQYLKPFFSLKNPDFCVFEGVQIDKYKNGLQCYLKDLISLNKGYKAPKYYSVKYVAFLINM